jgi:hypothetical protein
VNEITVTRRMVLGAAQVLAGLVLVLTMTWRLAPAAAEEICWTGGGTQFVDAIRYCPSSVLAPQGASTYGPKNLTDGNPATAWCEGAPGHGFGETITIRIDGGPPFRRLLISNGDGKSSQTSANNGRIKTLEITSDAGIQTIASLIDQNGLLPVHLLKPARHWVQLKIIDVYPGDRFADTCLADVTPDYEYEEELLQGEQGR